MMPFPGGIEETANGVLLLSVGAAALTLFMVDLPPRLVRSLVKTLAVSLLAVLAFVRQGPLLLVGALALSAAGDAFLSRDGERAFLAGLASFLTAHLLYIVLFVSLGGGAAALAETWRVGVAVAMALAAAAMIAHLLPRVAPKLRVPIIVYAAAILAMGLAALTTNSPAVIAGAILFMLSDGILATERFLLAAVSPLHAAMRYAVWVTYYTAQLLITFGLLLG